MKLLKVTSPSGKKLSLVLDQVVAVRAPAVGEFPSLCAAVVVTSGATFAIKEEVSEITHMLEEA